MREFAPSRVHQEWLRALLAHWLELEHVIPSTCKEGREISVSSVGNGNELF